MDHSVYINYEEYQTLKNSLRPHYHNGYQIIFITDGEAVFNINNKEYFCKKNSIVFLNNLEEHTMQILKTPYARYNLIVDSLFLDSIVMDSHILSIFKIRDSKFCHSFPINGKASHLIHKYFYSLSIIYDKKNKFWHLKFISHLLELLMSLYNNYENNFPIDYINQKNKSIIKVQKFIDTNFTNDFSIEDLSDKFFISKYHLIRSFKSMTGYTIKQYIILKRISLAKDLLYFTNKNIIDIALECGFNDQSNFIQAFKKREHLTPLQFRKFYKNNKKTT